MKSIALIGSTGSIGKQTIEVVKGCGELLKIRSLAAGTRLEELSKQVAELKPRFYACHSADSPATLHGAELTDINRIVEDDDTDTVVLAVDGIAGFDIAVKTLEAGKDLVLANKESLLIGGQKLPELAGQNGVTIVPMDSEPCAVRQCLKGEKSAVREILLTASGGAFRDRKWNDLRDITPQEAVRHPNWRMGAKVTTDSSNLVNKVFEKVECHLLFGVKYSSIVVVIHRQSAVHGAVKFADGTVKLVMTPPDMRYSIQYALLQPERVKNSELVQEWSLTDYPQLTFEPLREGDYPCYDLAASYAEKGDACTAALAGADQAAVELFLEGKIGYHTILDILGDTLKQAEQSANGGLESLREICHGAYSYARKRWDG